MKSTRSSVLRLIALIAGIVTGVAGASALQVKIGATQHTIVDARVVTFEVPKDAKTIVVSHNLGTLNYDIGDVLVLTGNDFSGECEYEKGENALTLRFREPRGGKYQVILEQRVRI